MRKTFVYYHPNADELCVRNENGLVVRGEYVGYFNVYARWSMKWDEYCEKNFILIGEL